MNKWFEGKVVLITGGASGQGKATVYELVNRGADVVFIDINEEKAKEVLAECERRGGNAEFRKCDLTKHEELMELFAYIKEKYGKLDFAGNIAGWGIPYTMIDSTTDEDIDRMINLNLKGLIYCMQEEIKLMRQQNFGRIVNIASDAAFMGAPGMAVLGATKAGVIGVTKNACLDVVREGITINSISPGAIETELVLSVKEQHPEEFEQYCRNMPVGRFGKPSEIAHGVCFFFEEESSFITGVNLPIDGGFGAGKMER